MTWVTVHRAKAFGNVPALSDLELHGMLSLVAWTPERDSKPGVHLVLSLGGWNPARSSIGVATGAIRPRRINPWKMRLHPKQPRAAGLNSPAFGVWFGPFGAVILGDRVPWVYSPVANCTHGY